MEQIRVFTIIDKQTGKVCGFCQFDMEQETEPEFGIDILDDYMGLGYGFQASKLAIEYAGEWENVTCFKWITHDDNIGSKKIAEKLGGTLISEKCAIPVELIEFMKMKGTYKEDEQTPQELMYKIINEK